ncbi:hypothetical protein IAT38_000753 [Cryptococcus sp. DSM 104549]
MSEPGEGDALVFEPTDIFDFDFDPIAPPPDADSPRFSPPPDIPGSYPFARPPSHEGTNGDGQQGEDVEMRDAGEEEMRRPERIRVGTPPPDFGGNDEPGDWEDEMALMEMERDEAMLRQRDREKERGRDRGSGERGEGSGGGSKEGADFVPTDIFDFDLPVASTSRVALTPPPDIDFNLDAINADIEASLNSSSLPPLVASTANGGSVIFRRRKKPKPLSAEEIAKKNGKVGAGDLLSVPLHKLLAEVREMKDREKALKMQAAFDAKGEGEGRQGASSSTMWVDKYRPKKFTDLLGEERVHREVLGWLKEWDKCVFKKAPPPKKRRMADDDEPEFEYDALGRPRERILLLSGPPGYGKTTLAQIVARHAGYRALEINASDDRNAATVTTRIKNALDAGSALSLTGGNRPTCVVVDEVDGAGGGEGGFVKALLKLIQDVPARKKTNTPAKPLRRPIICICNDLYAASLRPLRPFAKIVRFRKPQPQFLVRRLRDICQREALESDTRTLTALVDVTSGDVRSCLNTLQFIKSKSDVVTESAVRSSSLGLKDSGTTLQTAWSTLFIPLPAKQRRAQGIDDGRYLRRVVPTVQSCGEYDKLVMGLFEHYPNLKPLDASMANVVKTHDWLGFYDRLQGRVGEEQEWELMGYLPWAVGAWYPHMAAPANSAKPTEWPKADYECFQARTANEEIATTLKLLVPPVLRSLFSTTTTLTELIPFLMRIISPPLKPVNAHIVKPAEKAVLARLVEIMIPLGLRFWQEKGESGQPMMRLEPPIDVFVHYEGKRAEDILASRYAVRQLVSQAVDVELARRRGGAAAQDANGGSDALATAYGLKGSGAAPPGKGKVADKAALPVLDFFGRTVAVIPALPAENGNAEGDEDDDAPEPPRKKFRAIYKFNEGSSSAVRKCIKMSALM